MTTASDHPIWLNRLLLRHGRSFMNVKDRIECLKALHKVQVVELVEHSRRKRRADD